MNKDLYALADQLGIVVLSFPLPDCESISLESDDNYYIGIDDMQLDSSKEERVHMAHELGHCVTGSFYNEYSPVDNRGKCESTADRWAVKKLINKDELLKQLKKRHGSMGFSRVFQCHRRFYKKGIPLVF